jgi:hypothetical protein
LSNKPRNSTHNIGRRKSILSKRKKYALPFSLTTHKGIRANLPDEVCSDFATGQVDRDAVGLGSPHRISPRPVAPSSVQHRKSQEIDEG